MAYRVELGHADKVEPADRFVTGTNPCTLMGTIWVGTPWVRVRVSTTNHVFNSPESLRRYRNTYHPISIFVDPRTESHVLSELGNEGAHEQYKRPPASSTQNIVAHIGYK